MIYYLYVIAVLVSLVSAISKTNNRLVELLVLGIIVFLLGRGALTLDTYNYWAMYTSAPLTSFSQEYEKGYLLLEKIGNLVGLRYNDFRLLMTFASILLIRSTVVKATSNPQYVYWGYLIFLIFIDAVQLRNLFAFSVVVFASQFLIVPDSRSRIKFFIFLLLSSSIHVSSSLYLIVFLLATLDNKELAIKLVLFGTFIFALAVFLADNKIPFIEDVFGGLDEDLVHSYALSTTKLGFLYAFLFQFFSIALLFWAKRLFERYTPLDDFNSVESNYVNLIFFVNVMSVLFFPLYMANLQFIRLTRNYLIPNLIVYSLVFKKGNGARFQQLLFGTAVLVNLLTWFYFTFEIQDHMDDVIQPFFEEKVIDF